MMTSDRRGLEGPGHELRLEVLQERFRELDQQVARKPASQRLSPVAEERRRWLHRPRAPKPYALLPILDPPGQGKTPEPAPPASHTAVEDGGERLVRPSGAGRDGLFGGRSCHRQPLSAL